MENIERTNFLIKVSITILTNCDTYEKIPLRLKAMHTTRHLSQRMSQRGVSREMVDFVLEHGVPDQDRYVVGKRTALELLDNYQRRLRVLKKILDKGGVTVVLEDGNLITTYNFTGDGH